MYNASTDLNKFKVTWRGLDWDGGSSRSPPKFKVIAKVNQCHIKVTLKVTPENHSRGHSRSNLKIARKDMQGHFKVTFVNNVLSLPKLVKRTSNAS